MIEALDTTESGINNNTAFERRLRIRDLFSYDTITARRAAARNRLIRNGLVSIDSIVIAAGVSLRYTEAKIVDGTAQSIALSVGGALFAGAAVFVHGQAKDQELIANGGDPFLKYSHEHDNELPEPGSE